MFELSVLIPTYNRAKSLDRALKSLNSQSYNKKFKCLISDNNSKDETETVVNKWINKSTNFEIEYFKQEKDLLPIDNWEFLISKSKTLYSKILFDDDWIKPSFLEMSLGLLKIHNVDCVVSNIDIFVEKGNEEKMIVNYFKLREGIMNTGWLVDSFTEMGNRINVSPSASVLKTDKLKEAFYYSLKNIECTKKVIGNDLAINYFHLFNRGKVYYTKESLAICGAGEDSITVSTNDKILFYCYLNTLIDLINTFSIELTRVQKRILKRKIVKSKIRQIFNKKYRNYLVNKLN